MHWLDFVLFVVLGIGGLLGLRSGLLWQVARLVIFAAAIYGCIHYHKEVAHELDKVFDGLTESTAQLLAFAVIFLGVCLGGSLITWFLEHMLQAVHLKPLDRLLGAAVGVLKAGLLAGGLLTGMVLYGSKETQESMADSTIAPQLLEGTRWVLAAVPQQIKDDLGKKLDGMRKTAAEKARQTDR